MTTELTKAAQQALEACPFCGSKKIKVHIYGDAVIGGEPDAFAQCHDCSVIGPNGKTEAEAAQAWNTRALTQRPAAQTDEQTIVEICERIGFGRVQQIAGHAWEQKHNCAPRGRMGVTVRNEAPAPQQATPEPVKFSHAGHFYNLVAHALMEVKRPDACGHRLRLILDELATLMGQPATPEPVGEPDTVPLDALHAAERERDYWKTRARAMLDHADGTCWYWMGDGEDHLESLVSSLPVVIRADQLRELLARPAPGVPEGWRDAKNDPPPVGVDVLVAVEFDGPGDWRIKVGGRNPQERTGWCVFGASWVPQVWMPLDAHRAALAAAQAKGGEQ